MSIDRTDVEIALGPARGAYLVRAGDRGGVVEAIQVASTRWGGVTEPIIPVKASGRIDDLWSRVLEYSPVDGLINVNLAADVAEEVQRRLGLPLVDLNNVGSDALLGRTVYPSVVSSKDQAERPDRSVMVADQDAPLWLKAALGVFPPNHRRFDHPLPDVDVASLGRRDDLSAALAAQLRGGTWLGYRTAFDARPHGGTWLDYGASHLVAQFTGGLLGYTPVMVWMTRRDSLRDCVFFWNLRAIRSLRFFSLTPMLLVPHGLPVDWPELGRLIAMWYLVQSDDEPDVLIGSLVVEDNRLAEVADDLGLVPSPEPPCPGAHPTPQGTQGPPHTYWISRSPHDYFRFNRFYGADANTVAQVAGQEGRVNFDSPIEFRAPGRLLARLQSKMFDGLPRRRIIASMIRKGAEWHQNALQVNVATQERHRIPIEIPTLETATWALLKDRCNQAQVLDKGMLAQRLLELGGHHVLLDQHVRKTVAKLRTQRSEDSRRRGTLQRKFRAASDLRSLVGPEAGASAEALCEQRWAERGLGIDCTLCGIKSFVPLDQSQSAPTCPACRASQPFKINNNTGVPEIHYRLEAQIDRAADQGVLSHLLAVAVLEQAHEHVFIIPGATLDFADSSQREIDLFGARGGIVVAGEAKTDPKGFIVDNIAREVELSARLGADAHLMAAMDAIAKAATNKAAQCTAERGIGLIVIEGENMRTLVQPQ